MDKYSFVQVLYNEERDAGVWTLCYTNDSATAKFNHPQLFMMQVLWNDDGYHFICSVDCNSIYFYTQIQPILMSCTVMGFDLSSGLPEWEALFKQNDRYLKASHQWENSCLMNRIPLEDQHIFKPFETLLWYKINPLNSLFSVVKYDDSPNAKATLRQVNDWLTENRNTLLEYVFYWSIDDVEQPEPAFWLQDLSCVLHLGSTQAEFNQLCFDYNRELNEIENFNEKYMEVHRRFIQENLDD